jgi:tRNA (guanine37-N1)-methyltransferase
MRIDIVTIFPAFFDVLDVSLIGKARDRGILDMHVHDLRDWTHDRHRTVDDTPYGGGAGMVMKPEPWGEALDEVLTPDAVLIVPSPAGELFTQRMARATWSSRADATRASTSASSTTTPRAGGCGS